MHFTCGRQKTPRTSRTEDSCSKEMAEHHQGRNPGSGAFGLVAGQENEKKTSQSTFYLNNGIAFKISTQRNKNNPVLSVPVYQ